MTPGQKPTAPPAQANPPPIDRDAYQHQLEATMPDSMALVKLKGFIFDLGGEVVESIPGMIRVRLLGEQKKSGMFSWGTPTAPAAPGTDLELRTERPDPAQPSRLTVTLVMRPTSGRPGQEWETFCKKIARDLQAYLIGR